MSTWYISGPMRGYKHFNFAAFKEAEQYLTEVMRPSVITIFNPARHDAEILGMGWEPDETQAVTEAQLHSWMRKDLSEVAASANILLLPGWEDSTGARREVSVARWCGVNIYLYDPSGDRGFRLTFPWDPHKHYESVVTYVDAVLAGGLDKADTVSPMEIERTDVANQEFQQKAATLTVTEDYLTDTGQTFMGARVYTSPDVPANVGGYCLNGDYIYHDDAWAPWDGAPAEGDSGEVRSVNALTGGEKGVKPARFDLLPARPLETVARHYGIGAAKYEDRNWEKGYEWSKSFAALQRHLWAYWGGEDIDSETGSPHLAAAVFHCLALLEWADTHPEMDDRP